MNTEIRHFASLGIEIIEEIRDPVDPSGWEILVQCQDWFEEISWQLTFDEVLLWNVPTSEFWTAWHQDKYACKCLGFQAYPNQAEHAQDVDAEWIVYFDRHQHLDFCQKQEMLGNVNTAEV